VPADTVAPWPGLTLCRAGAGRARGGASCPMLHLTKQPDWGPCRDWYWLVIVPGGGVCRGVRAGGVGRRNWEDPTEPRFALIQNTGGAATNRKGTGRHASWHAAPAVLGRIQGLQPGFHPKIPQIKTTVYISKLYLSGLGFRV